MRHLLIPQLALACSFMLSGCATHSDTSTTAAPQPFIKSFTSYHSKSGFNGLLGYTFVPQVDLEITHLGQWKQSGSADKATLLLADGETREPISSSQVTLDLNGKEEGAFHYAVLPSPLTLEAGKTYLLLTEKSDQPDLWYHEYTILETTAAADVIGSIWKHPVTGEWKQQHFPQTGYGPLTFKYRSESAIAEARGDTWAVVSEAEYLPRGYYGRRLEPESGVLHGAGQSVDAFKKYAELMPDTPPAIYMIYTGLGFYKEGWIKKLTGVYDEMPFAPIPQLGLSMTIDGKPERRYEHKIASGEYDEEIDLFVKELKDYGKPIYIRLGYEFNGPWNGYFPESFREAWIRVVKKVREAGIKHAAFVWCISGDGKLDNIMDFYPGDEWVDWWAVDIFATNHLYAPEVIEFVEEAEHRGFPVMIGESTPRYIGSKNGEASWRLWYQPYFNFIRSNPNVKAFCYINWNWDGTPWNWGEGRIQHNELVEEKYLEEVSQPFYLHGPQEVF